MICPLQYNYFDVVTYDLRRGLVWVCSLVRTPETDQPRNLQYPGNFVSGVFALVSWLLLNNLEIVQDSVLYCSCFLETTTIRSGCKAMAAWAVCLRCACRVEKYHLRMGVENVSIVVQHTFYTTFETFNQPETVLRRKVEALLLRAQARYPPAHWMGRMSSLEFCCDFKMKWINGPACSMPIKNVELETKAHMQKYERKFKRYR